MKKQIVINLFVLLGALFYSFLFYHYQLGLNALLLSLGIACILLWQDKERFRSNAFKAVLGSHLYTAILVVIHHSIIAQGLYIITLFTLIGYAQQRNLRFLWYGILLGVGSIMIVPITSLKVGIQFDWAKYKILLKWVQLTILPIIVAAIFFIIYYQASTDFANIFKGIATWWGSWNFHFSFPWLSRFLIGFFLMGALLWPSVIRSIISDRESQWRYDLIRTRKKGGFPFYMLALKQAHLSALISLSLLNSLLLLVNLTDFRYIWLDFSEKSATELSNYVHAGTNLLILAIGLAIAILLYFFRGNLNFFPDKTGRLQALAYIWVIQNALLALSVGFRNFHYLRAYGLTYLRIGVMVFLIIVFFGLILVYQKIKARKTDYYLLATNAWSVLAILLVCASFNWDLIITRYNIFQARTTSIDAYYLGAELSDKNLYLLKRHAFTIEQKAKGFNQGDLQEWIIQKELSFQKRIQKQDWRSWNWMDHRIKKRL